MLLQRLSALAGVVSAAPPPATLYHGRLTRLAGIWAARLDVAGPPSAA